MTRDALQARAHEVRERAASLAESITAANAGFTSTARERAVLRLFGVDGLDRCGRPLAHQVVERFAADPRQLLPGGVALPFAATALAYDLSPQETALEIAGGYLDPGLEADALARPVRRATAVACAADWTAAALRRFEANRTARRELRDLLGEPSLPLVATHLEPAPAGTAADEATVRIDLGADVVRVDVPRDRELRHGLDDPREDTVLDLGPQAAPAGSQRGLAFLRERLDDAAARHGRFVRLATRAAGPAAPEAAVVAGFERVDLLFSDPVEGIVELGIEPERAFLDHGFALELLRLGGAILVIGPGPAVVAPELSRGEPIDPATRSGRAIALQALNIELARAGGLDPERVLVGSLPADLFGNALGLTRGLVEIELRRLLFPESGYALEEPPVHIANAWPVALTSWIAGSFPPRLVMTTADHAVLGRRRDELDAARRAAEGLVQARGVGPLRGEARDDASRALHVAVTTLRLITTDGWAPLIGPTRRGRGRERSGPRRRRADPSPLLPRPPAGRCSGGRVRRC